MSKPFSAAEILRSRLREFDEVESSIRACPSVASLRKINEALLQLTASAEAPVHEIAELIGRDQALTSRLLRLVNSVFGGLATKTNNLDEAIFFLGMRQVRQLAVTAPVIEEMKALARGWQRIHWESIWRHSIATAIYTREILSMSKGVREDDTYYIFGLLHDVGKLVMLYAYPDAFTTSLKFEDRDPQSFAAHEKEMFGWTHAELGALYLERNGLASEIVEAVLFHTDPENAPLHPVNAAAVQLADCLCRGSGIPSDFEPQTGIDEIDWEELPGWEILFRGSMCAEQIARVSLMNSMERLPAIVNGLL